MTNEAWGFKPPPASMQNI